MRELGKVIVFILVGMVSLTEVVAESFYEASRFNSLTSDHKAMKIGDSVTVVIVENATAQANTGTSSDQEFGVSGGLNLTNRDELGSLDIGMERDSAGSTAREGMLRAQISVSVLEVSETGRMRVEGEQSIILNGETQKISVKGWLRPQDIGANNVALSTRLTDSEISFTGEGDQSDTNKPGIIYRVFEFIGLI